MNSLPNTERLAAERARWVAAGTAGRPFFVASASGARITDVDGREFIDFVSGIGTVNHGHRNPEIVAAIHAVMDAAFERGLLLMGAGVYSNCIRVLVPLVATDTDVDEGLSILAQSLAEAAL